MSRWEDVRDRLRQAIADGTYPPGQTIPKEEELMELYAVSRSTVRQAVADLKAAGLLEPIRRRGTVVRKAPARIRLNRTRRVYRDELGYFFDPAAQGWRALQPPTITWGPCPADVRQLLKTPEDQHVLIRDRVMGIPETGTATQLATSYIPAAIAQGAIAEADTGPGGIYDRMEEDGLGPLHWDEAVTARMPTPTEAATLKLAAGIPVLRILRTTRAPDGQVLEVNDTRMDAEQYELGYPLTRDASASLRQPEPP